MPCRRATASMLAPPAASARMLRISRSLLCRVPTRCPLPSTWPQGPARRGRYQREECLAPGERLRRGTIAANARTLSIRGVEAGLTRPRNALWRSRVALRTRSVIRPSAGPLAWSLPDSTPAAPPATERGAGRMTRTGGRPAARHSTLSEGRSAVDRFDPPPGGRAGRHHARHVAVRAGENDLLPGAEQQVERVDGDVGR